MNMPHYVLYGVQTSYRDTSGTIINIFPPLAILWNIGSSRALIDCWSVRRAWQLDYKRFITNRGDIKRGARWLKWLERELTDRKVRGSNPTSASRLPLSRLGQPGSIPALVLPSGGMAARHRKGATAEQENAMLLIVGLFAELGSWIANVSSPIEVTSSRNTLIFYYDGLSNNFQRPYE
ncbi:hypothetical protein CSKR_110233 [Clonorchis sinensis]|uniref:Uncharacterized protein n=1 Tax=Clonorchis sinensis TaxID=79923 RepID=A0A419PEP3_CLOSI|nr:hypothetical protein CSKR_110233 [Clonorchis sinensis]